MLLTRPNTEFTGHGRNEDRDDINEVGAFLLSDTQLLPTLKLVASARLDHSNQLPDVVFSPRAALIYKPAAGHNIRLTFNKGFHTPSSGSIFRDVNLFPNIGSLPYDLRLRGVPRTGYHFRRDQDGGLGGLYMQSPYNPEDRGGRAAYLPADATLMWEAVVAILQQNGVDLSALPVPTADQVGTVLRMFDVNTGQANAIVPDDVQDIPALKPQQTTTFEVGYRGLIGNKLMITSTLYHERNKNTTGVYLNETPSVFYDLATLTSYLGQFMPTADAEALAANISTWIPIGTVTPEEGDPADLLMTTRNRGNIEHWGAELGLTFFASKNWMFGGNYTYYSENIWREDDWALNAPKNKVGLHARYKNANRGVQAQARLRYVESFPAITGLGRDVVPAFTVVDVSARYQLPVTPDLEVSVSIQNLLNNKHREFLKFPEIGRLAMVRLAYAF